MNDQFRPSKQFLIRGGIATGIIALILIVQTDWFRALFNKAPLPPVVPDKTIGEFIAQDSNGNGIADWEEKLWGLDPTALYTNGVANKTLIEQKKQSLGVSFSGEPENETDALARELFTITAALGDSEQLSAESLAAVGQRLADTAEFETSINHYSLKDVKTVPTTIESLENYYNRFSALAAERADTESELDIVATAMETGDTSGLESLIAIEADYQAYAKALLATPVPVGIQLHHLESINSIYGLSVAVGYMGTFSDNGATALGGIALYKISDARLLLAAQELHSYFLRYGILDE